jgi:cyclopropane-fatty-acyl-phospholipid synthase
MMEKVWAGLNTPHSLQLMQGFYETLVYKALDYSRLGILQVGLPDGREWDFGTPVCATSDSPIINARIQVKNRDFFRKCVLYGDIGFGESYVDGDWETDNLTDLISWFILNHKDSPTLSNSKRRHGLINMLGSLNQLLHRLRPNSLHGSKRNICSHYDLSNELFKTFLDPTLTYSCAYYRSESQSLESAQVEKYDVLCQKLKLEKSDKVLEIGCGWGGFSRHAVRNYGCQVTAITISRQQFQYVDEMIRREGLGDQIDLRLQDYREVAGRYDKIVSIEMLEAVGEKYVDVFFQKCSALLKPWGLLGIQVITCSDARFKKSRRNVDWIQKHIFPGSLILSISAIDRAISRTGDLCLHHMEDIGQFYAKTMLEWHAAFSRNINTVRELGFDDRFIRKWNYYLLYCQAAFAMRYNTAVQAVYTRQGNCTL